MTANFIPILSHAGPPIANHLWQSTVFVGAIGILASLFGNNRARVRYWLWFAASLKFLVPFSAFVALGSIIPLSNHATPVQPSLISTAQAVVHPFSVGAATHDLNPHSFQGRTEARIPAALGLIWALGFAAVLLAWHVRWRQVSTILRRSALADERREVVILRRLENDINLKTRIRFLISGDLMEPGVFGIFRPALLWPAQLSDRLEDAHLEAILAHEVAHVQHRDNLTASLHMVVEAIFWFHPFVWWIERKMIEERERACDEAVLQSGSKSEIYAESLLKVSRFCAELPLPCVAGITGADLRKRICSIMLTRSIDLGIGKKLLLTALTLCVIVGPVASGMIQKAPPAGQILHATGSQPSFEVASIKPSAGSGPTMIGAAGHAAPKDRFIATNITAKALICWAFAGTSVPLPSNEVSDGPGWINSERYDIDAKLDDSQTAAIAQLSANDQIVQVRLMVQSLLADRFKLVAKDTTVTRPVYALVIAKGGTKMHETVPGSESPIKAGDHQVQFSGGRGEMSGHGIPMTLLVRFLSQAGGLGRPVVDKTGLSGNYDVELKWNPDLDSPEMMQGQSPGARPSSSDSSGPSIFTAIQDQLGLRLKATEGPVEDLVIAKIEKPSEN
jgi:uncharacterized protein (TIGR03435 family)